MDSAFRSAAYVCEATLMRTPRDVRIRGLLLPRVSVAKVPCVGQAPNYPAEILEVVPQVGVDLN